CAVVSASTVRFRAARSARVAASPPDRPATGSVTASGRRGGTVRQGAGAERDQFGGGAPEGDLHARLLFKVVNGELVERSRAIEPEGVAGQDCQVGRSIA